MKTLLRPGTVLIALLSAILLSCTQNQRREVSSNTTFTTLIEVKAVYDAETDRHLFQTDTDTIPSGWTTFRLANASPMLHFILLNHLPGDRTSTELLNEVSPVFQKSSDLIAAGKTEEGMGVFSELPEWFGELVYRGGPGFISPGQTTEATLYLEPGNYVMECYIKTADGDYHWKKGMYKDLRVLTDTTDAPAPENPSIEITTNDDGFDVKGELSPGNHLVAVHFNEENPGMIARDIHVVQLDAASKMDEILNWFDFTKPGSLISTMENPGPAKFLGGVHDMPRGNTAYFSVDLKPGNYAWISEQPVAHASYEKFTVGDK